MNLENLSNRRESFLHSQHNEIKGNSLPCRGQQMKHDDARSVEQLAHSTTRPLRIRPPDFPTSHPDRMATWGFTRHPRFGCPGCWRAGRNMTIPAPRQPIRIRYISSKTWHVKSDTDKIRQCFNVAQNWEEQTRAVCIINSPPLHPWLILCLSLPASLYLKLPT